MKKSFYYILLISVSLLFFFEANSQTYIFVQHDASGNNDGTSWVDAYTSLQSAFSAASSGNNIWVTSGTYEPSNETGGTGVRYRSFQLKNGVGLYGGFAGNEDPATFNLNDRDFIVNETILTGATDMVYHIFRHMDLGLISTAILNGFTISGGKADGTDPDNKGGGMLNFGSTSGNGSSPTIVHCIFKNNQASEGGAIYNSRYSSPAITYTTFSDNSVSSKGGAVFSTRNTPTFSYCTFIGNVSTGSIANDGGGAIYNNAQNAAEGVVVSNCTFTNNSIPITGTNTYGGGAIYSSLDPGKLEISASTFNGNTGKYGGAIYHRSGNDVNRDNSVVSISQSSFYDNNAEYGGAIFSDRHHTLVTSSYIRGNEALEQAGGFYSRYASSEIVNSIISGNKSGKHGGGVYFNTETPEIINTTISGNHSGERGGGISIIGGSVIALKNSILYGNSSPEGNELWICNTCTSNTNYSLYGNASGDVFITIGGSNNVTNSSTLDPLFLNLIIPTSVNTPNTLGNYMIKSTSPAIDAANNSNVPGSLTEDLRGKDRIIDGDNNAMATVDMGAYEYDPDYCNSTPPSIGDGSSTTPYQISTLGHLCWISQNSGEWSKYFIQMADIDASDTEFWDDGAGFLPIGNTTTIFNGNFNGNSFPILNLYINRTSSDNIGLFGNSRGTLSNVVLYNVNVSGNDNVGALVGYNRYSTAVINNCSSAGFISGNNLVGGLIGFLESSAVVSNCYSHCNVSASYRVGGLIGRSSGGMINDSYATGNVSGSATSSNTGGFIGGMVGSSTTTNCYSTGNVRGTTNVGGFVASMNGSTISKCFSKGEVTASGASAAGFIGLQTTGLVENSYSHGNIVRTSGTSTWNGGFVGRNWQGKIINSYSIGRVTYENGTDPTNRGFAGPVDIGGDYEMTSNFWDKETSLQSTTEGNATGETTDNMKTQSTFTNAGWDFNTIWGIDTVDNDGYPYFLYSEIVLPIELFWFEAECLHPNVLLKWATASEINNDYFTIYRSTDGVSFENIGVVAGAGNSNQTLDYSFIDCDAFSGISYYRLKQTDFDGHFENLKIVPVSCIDEVLRDIKVYPNPVTNELTIEIAGNNERISFVIINSMGAVVYKGEINQKITVHTLHFAPGTYIIKFENDKTHKFKKVIKK